MNKTFPEDRKLAQPARLRPFKADLAILPEISRQTGLEADEIKRRAIHVGLPELAKLLGVTIGLKKAA